MPGFFYDGIFFFIFKPSWSIGETFNFQSIGFIWGIIEASHLWEVQILSCFVERLLMDILNPVLSKQPILF